MKTVSTPRFSIVIPVHNNLAFTRQCLEGIAQTSAAHPYEVIVVDNASTDGTRVYLESLGDAVTVIANGRNETYSHANNQGAEVARGDVLVFLNNDTKPFPGWLDALAEGFEADIGVGIQGAKLLYGNSTIQHAGMVFGARPGRREEPYHAYLCADPSAAYVNRMRDVQFVTGACLAMRRELFEEVGGFDEEYVYGWEDTDLCMAAQAAGKRVVYNPRVVLFHFESLTKKIRDPALLDNEAPHERMNRERFFAKWEGSLRRDAEAFYAEDGFALRDGTLVSMEPEAPRPFSSFAPRFWERNYAQAKTVLIRCNGAIGDSLTVTAIATNLKTQHPHLEIIVSGDERVEWIFRHLPAMARFVVKGSNEEQLALAKADTVVDYHDVIGRMGDFYNGIGYMDVLANLAGVRLDYRDLHYTVEPEEADWAQRMADSLGTSLMIGLQLHTDKDLKRSYPHAPELVRRLSERYPQARFILFGQEPLGATHPAVFDCASESIPFRRQMALAYCCHAFLTIDSAFFHIGHNLCKKPTLTIFGVTNPLLSGNPGAGFGVVQNRDLACLSCYWQTPCRIECMAQLAPDAVVEAFDKLLTDPAQVRVLKALEPARVPAPPAPAFERALLDQLWNRPIPAHLVIQDPQGVLPEYASRWNGVSVVRQERFAIRWEGSQLVRHSLALVNRELCLQLIDAGQALSLVPYEPDNIAPEADPRFSKLAERLRVPLPHQADVHVRHQWPPRFEPPVEGHWVIIQPWEFGSIPQEWVDPMTHQVDEIWVPTSFVKECYLRSGIPAEKVHVVPNGVNVERFHPEVPPYRLSTRKRFKFLFVGGTIGRKGIDILLDVYARTFTGDDDVCLVIKDMGGKSFYQGQTAGDLIDQVRALPNAPEIEYLDEMLSDEELVGLYTACDALVHPYRGEGFALPIAEAMACGLPVIVTGYGACLDFCDEKTAFLIPAREVGLESTGLPPSSKGYWLAEPNRQALANLMRDVVLDPAKAQEIARAGRERIVSQFQWSHAAEKVLERVSELAKRPPVRVRQAEPFRPGLEPLPVEGRRGLTFFHHPNWSAEAWREVLVSYAGAFTPEDDVALMLWLDPKQGLSEDAVSERLMEVLEANAIDPEACPDIILVPNGLERDGLARLYAAADWVVPHGDIVQKIRAEKVGIPVLETLSRDAWRMAMESETASSV